MKDDLLSVHLEQPDFRERARLIDEDRGVLSRGLDVQRELGAQCLDQVRGQFGIGLALDYESGRVPITNQERQFGIRLHQGIPASVDRGKQKTG